MWCGRGGVAVAVWPWWCGRGGDLDDLEGDAATVYAENSTNTWLTNWGYFCCPVFGLGNLEVVRD